MLNFEIKTRQKDFCPNATFCAAFMGTKRMKIGRITTWETKRWRFRLSMTLQRGKQKDEDSAFPWKKDFSVQTSWAKTNCGAHLRWFKTCAHSSYSQINWKLDIQNAIKSYKNLCQEKIRGLENKLLQWHILLYQKYFSVT